MRKVVLNILIVSSLLILAACRSTDVDPLADNVLTVGMECGYAPFNWTTSEETDTSVPISGSNAYCDGYDVKIASYIAEELGVELEIKMMAFEALIQALNTNQIDVIIAGMSPTESRKEVIHFTDVYYRSEQVVVVHKDGAFTDAKSIYDFEGAKIAAQLSTLQEVLIDQLVGASKETSSETYGNLVVRTNTNLIDGFIAELPVAMQIVNSNPELIYVTLTEEGFNLDDADVSTSIGVKKSNTQLRDDINDILATISESERQSWMNEFISASPEEQ